ncbi:tripartite tricarboxylate transporter TctB family protein [Yoonia sp.]|uniref:tripartite tricarboxylate transporter TctB family protein n=1 Tax=Yoonia sp. TaxID=2212373 RepID=UPI003A4D2931
MSMRTGWRANTADIVLGSVIFLIGLWLFANVQSLASGPRLFPRFIVALMAATGAGIVAVAIVSGIRGQSEAMPVAWFRSIGIPAVILILAAIILYAFGFYVTSPLLIFTVYMWHRYVSTGAIHPRRDTGVAAALAVGATLVMYAVFNQLIGLPAPAGAFL